ncbi:spore germination protein GerPC [Paenibacillus sp. GCM10027628]|uniref:spore germination protein GerPC n=1 Tax=Paenibacillus sp. GCM10027628 TaxID=3273413 RepID=UPI0036346003
MYNPISWQQWTQQLCTYIETQKQRIDKLEQTVNNLEQTITKLQTALNSVKDQKGIHIDRIEYKFDQLKVEKLDGTLTIGISPSSLHGIEDFNVNGVSIGKEGLAGTDQGSVNPMAPGQGEGIGIGPDARSDSNVQQEVFSGIEQYLQQGVHADMRNLEHKYQHPLDDDYKEMILDDIRRQLDTRIRHYVGQYRSIGFKEPMEEITTSIMEKTKNDILSALDSYISSLPRKDGPS